MSLSNCELSGSVICVVTGAALATFETTVSVAVGLVDCRITRSRFPSPSKSPAASETLAVPSVGSVNDASLTGATEVFGSAPRKMSSDWAVTLSLTIVCETTAKSS